MKSRLAPSYDPMILVGDGRVQRESMSRTTPSLSSNLYLCDALLTCISSSSTSDGEH